MKRAALLSRLPLLAVAASLTVFVVAQLASATTAPAPLPVDTPSVTATTGTSITLYWKAPADPSIVGYAMYLNGTRVAGVQNIHYTFANLSCGKSYDLSLDSYNQAQIHSARTTVTASTAPCTDTSAPSAPAPPPAPTTPTPAKTDTSTQPTTTTPALPKTPTTTKTPSTPTTPTIKPTTQPSGSSAGVFVAPGGSDANPCTQTKPCLTFDRAYHLAQAGQTVQVAGGSYPAQSLTRDATKVSASSNVVFQTASGQLATVAGITLSDVHHVTFVGGSHGDLSSPSSGITLKPSPGAMDTGSDFYAGVCSSYVTVKDVDMRQFGVSGSDNVTIDGGTAGGYDNSGGDSFVGPPYQNRGSSTCSAENPYNVLIKGVLFHDVLRTNMPSAHPDCLQFYGTAGATVDSSRFVRCGTSNVMVRPNNGYAIDNLAFTNNSFTPSVEGGAVAVLGTPTDTCGRISLSNNTSAGSLSAYQCNTFAKLSVTGNTTAGATRYACQMVLAKPNVYFSGNVDSAGYACNSSTGATPPSAPTSSTTSLSTVHAVQQTTVSTTTTNSSSSLDAARMRRLVQLG